uniref:Uncharacterized protein n=1 Tax=Glossina morsitans morsitans TaxID=37546 RepID=A0A1B0FKP4_GLOMM
MYERKLNVLDESRDLATQAIAQKSSIYEEYHAPAKGRIDRYDHNDAAQAVFISFQLIESKLFIHICFVYVFFAINSFNLIKIKYICSSHAQFLCNQSKFAHLSEAPSPEDTAHIQMLIRKRKKKKINNK